MPTAQEPDLLEQNSLDLADAIADLLREEIAAVTPALERHLAAKEGNSEDLREASSELIEAAGMASHNYTAQLHIAFEKYVVGRDVAGRLRRELVEEGVIARRPEVDGDER
jgi:hypothetical protein